MGPELALNVTTMLEAAREYHALGLSVIPVCWPTANGCGIAWHDHEEDRGRQDSNRQVGVLPKGAGARRPS